ncbi:uncharacterized protein LOC128667307 [Microplitis demolitor]|uniref:uncharacterized protein LOC128667307 n=1 Tax=Microplitis demolitor TaxID=69319 RepID=UPI00043FFEB9|nr:uncharacterized protein LOC128667307 [Microplitis demolitor]
MDSIRNRGNAFCACCGEGRIPRRPPSSKIAKPEISWRSEQTIQRDGQKKLLRRNTI